ncbi:hypothetical protein MBLNU13_g07323t1 [Cladosporium sp. NU13]
MTPPVIRNDHPALYPTHEKPALVALTGSSVPGSDHGSQDKKLENGSFYDSAASDISPTLSGADEKKLLRRIDWRLLPLLAAMYVIKTIDAQNVSNARAMDKGTEHNIMIELNMSSDQFNLVTVAYYIPYIVAEAPSNLVLKYMKPSVWQARVMVSWGIVLCCHSVVKNAGGLYTVRALLGLMEAGLWPGILLQLCYWYRPDELAKRIVLVTIFGNFSAVISGVLAFAFNGVKTGGLSGWKWLILTEGIVTIVLGIAVFFLLPDCAFEHYELRISLVPSTVTWLSEDEKSFIQGRLPINSPKSSDKDFDWQEFKNTFKDYRLWLFLGVWGFYTVGTTGLTFYQPSIVAELGFTSIAEAQLLNLPPAIFSCLLVIFFGWLASTATVPLPAIPLFFMIAIEACYAVEYTYPNVGGVYAATLLAGGFSTAWYIMMWPWRVQTINGATGSAFAIAFANSYGQIGGAVGAQLFNSRFAPRYETSFAIAMGFVGIAIVVASITWYFTGSVDIEMRRERRARIAASKQE